MKYVLRLAAIVLSGFAVLAPAAQAHTALSESLPGDGAVMREAPDTLSLRFSAEVQLVQATIKDSAGAALETAYELDETTKREFSLPLPELNEGNYVVEWTAVGKDDGHTVLGDFGFSIDSRAVAGAAK